MPTYPVDQIIGKGLVAKQPVKIKRAASDQAADVYTVPTGTSVGIVYSYLMPTAGRSTLYWEFIDSNGRSYYAAHRPGFYDVESLKNQGALTFEEQKKQEEEKNLSTADKAIRAGTNVLLILGAGAFLFNFLKKQ